MTLARVARGVGGTGLGSPAGGRGRIVLHKNSHRSSPVARAAGPLGFPPQHPGRGYRRPDTPNLSWLANERLVCHALVVPKRWQRAKEASLCMEVCNLAHSVSSDADAPRNGGMTTSGALATGARCRRGSGGTGTGSIGRGHGGDAPRYNHIYSSSEFAQAARPLGFPPQHPAAGAVAQTPYFVASLLH